MIERLPERTYEYVSMKPEKKDERYVFTCITPPSEGNLFAHPVITIMQWGTERMWTALSLLQHTEGQEFEVLSLLPHGSRQGLIIDGDPQSPTGYSVLKCLSGEVAICKGIFPTLGPGRTQWVISVGADGVPGLRVRWRWQPRMALAESGLGRR